MRFKTISLPRLNKRKLFEEVVEGIQEMVISGKIHPQDQLPSESILGSQLGVSRTVVREAVKVLEQRGILQIEPGRGTFIAKPSISTVIEPFTLILKLERIPFKDLLVVRKLLEIEIVGLAAVNRTDGHLEQLRNALSLMESNIVNPDLFIDADTSYHATLGMATGNALYAVLIQPIVVLMKESRKGIAYTMGAFLQALEFHRKILVALETRDSMAARTLMREHLDLVGYHVTQQTTTE